MSVTHVTAAGAAARLALAALALTSAFACSPGSLPGSPSPILVGGGGGRYNGSIVTRRLVTGPYTITEASQSLNLSMVVRDAAQVTGRFESGETSGTLQGVLTGTLASGTFQATLLVSTIGRQGTTASTCEGRGDITASLSGTSLSWNGGTITYNNCPGLTVTTSAQAVAVSPIPGSFGNTANVIITIAGGASVARGTCPSGISGFPFTVEMAEMAGITVTFDSEFEIEQRTTQGIGGRSTLDMPFTELKGGERRSYSACSPVGGTYQAFFSGADANGNRVRVATPVVTMGP